MTHLPLLSFPAHAVDRSFYLSQINQEMKKSTMAKFLVSQGIDRETIKLYWDTSPLETLAHHGYCFVELPSRKLAVLAWARLDGLRKADKTLVVHPLKKPGALNPSRDELIAAIRQQPAGPANPTPQAPPLPPQVSSRPLRVPPPSVPPQDDASDHKRKRADLEEPYPRSIKKRRAHGTGSHPAGRTHGAPPSGSQAPSSKRRKAIWSDPSLLETIQLNADKVWPGWGGYGPFQAEPGRGPIDPREVQALNWHDPAPFRFVRDGGGEVTVELSASSTAGGKGGRTESLWFLLARASGGWTDEELREEEKKLPLPRDVGL